MLYIQIVSVLYCVRILRFRILRAEIANQCLIKYNRYVFFYKSIFISLNLVKPNGTSYSSAQDSSSVGPSCSVADNISATTVALTSEQSKTLTNNSSSRKKAFIKFVKDPQTITEDLIRKRAKNTEAARRSRQRKLERMESLEKQVAELTIENNELKTRLTVLEIEKKSLEEKNLDKDSMIKLLERQLTEAHQRILNRADSQITNTETEQ
jgi:hypothetical protein